MAQSTKPIFGFIIWLIIGGILFAVCCVRGGCCGRSKPKPTPQPSTPNRGYVPINPIGPTPPPSVTCSAEFIGYDTNGNLNSACGQSPCNPTRPGYDIYNRLNRSCGNAFPPPPPRPNQA